MFKSRLLLCLVLTYSPLSIGAPQSRGVKNALAEKHEVEAKRLQLQNALFKTSSTKEIELALNEFKLEMNRPARTIMQHLYEEDYKVMMNRLERLFHQARTKHNLPNLNISQRAMHRFSKQHRLALQTIFAKIIQGTEKNAHTFLFPSEIAFCALLAHQKKQAITFCNKKATESTQILIL